MGGHRLSFEEAIVTSEEVTSPVRATKNIPPRVNLSGAGSAYLSFDWIAPEDSAHYGCYRLNTHSEEVGIVRGKTLGLSSLTDEVTNRRTPVIYTRSIGIAIGLVGSGNSNWIIFGEESKPFDHYPYSAYQIGWDLRQ
tara:strand:- start:2112 stop:2525 length:414 start_codon:yes stop_codon:yes gene_type:complete